MNYYEHLTIGQETAETYTIRVDSKVRRSGNSTSILAYWRGLNIGNGHTATLRKDGKLIAKKY